MAPATFPDNAAAAAALFGSTAAAVQQPFKHMGGAGSGAGSGSGMGRGGYKSARRGRGVGINDRSSDTRYVWNSAIQIDGADLIITFPKNVTCSNKTTGCLMLRISKSDL